MQKLTREEDFGWAFFYNSKQFVETGDIEWALGGNAPLIVDRSTGELHSGAQLGAPLAVGRYDNAGGYPFEKPRQPGST
jgi:hypothetical protein